MENRSKGIIIILSVLLIVAGVAAVYFGISLSGMETKLDNLENKVESNEDNQTSDKIQVKDESKVETVENTSNKVEVKEENIENPNDKVEVFKNGIISNENCLNKINADYMDYSIFDISLIGEGNSISVLGSSAYCRILSSGASIFVGEVDTATQSMKYKEIKIENIDKRITYAGLHNYRDDDQALIFVLEDGTVNYLRMHYDIAENNFKSTKLNNVKNVVSVIAGIDGHNYTPLFITSEGKFYDGRKLMNNL